MTFSRRSTTTLDVSSLAICDVEADSTWSLSVKGPVILFGGFFKWEIPKTMGFKTKTTSRARASRVAEVSRFKKCTAIGSKNKFCLQELRQTSIIFAELLSSCLRFWHRSSTFLSSLSSHLNSFQLVLAYFTSVAPVQFPLSHVEVSETSYCKACKNYFPVLLRTTMLAQSTPQYNFVLQSLHIVLPNTTSYYKACTKYFPVLLRTTKLAQSTSQYYFVLQSLRKVLPSTTSYYKACTKYACTKYFAVLLRSTKLAQRTS